MTAAWSTPVECGQSGVDFAEFDAVAADLDLFVGAAEVLQLAVRAPAHQVAGAIHPTPGLAERAGDEPRCSQTRTPYIAAAHPATGDVELTDHPGRYRPQPPVEDEQRRARHRRADRDSQGLASAAH